MIHRLTWADQRKAEGESRVLPKDSRKLSPAADMSAPVSGRATMVQVPFGVLMFACTIGALEA